MTGNQVTPQKEIEELEGLAYEMEKRLVALKNAYAENPDQQRDKRHTYSNSHATGVGLNLHKKIAVSPEERYHMIAKEAYFRSKRHDFDPTTLVQDWIEAEAEIEKMLTGNEMALPEPHHDTTLHGHE